MRSSHPRVLALGECAQHRGVVYGIVAPIHEQAEVLAASLCGDERAYAGSVPAAKLKVMGVDVVTAGVAEGPRAVVVADADAGSYRKLIVEDGRAAGAVLLGDTRGAELLLDAVRRAQPVDDPLGLLHEAARPTPPTCPTRPRSAIATASARARSSGRSASAGLGSTAEVVAATRAGPGCGSCKPVVTELLTLERGGAAEEPAYLCPCRKQTREQLAALCRERDLDSVSALAQACGAGRDCGACKPGLAYLVSRGQPATATARSATRASSTTASTPTSSATARSRVVPRIRGGVTSPRGAAPDRRRRRQATRCRW